MTFKKVTSTALGKTSIALLSVAVLTSAGTVSVNAATHVIQAGESFFSIAAQYNMDAYDLAARNGKGIFDTINPGDTLEVDGVASPATPAASTASYTVQAGDSFFSIASAHGMAAQDLATLNGKTIFDTINPGDTLQVNATTPAPSAAPATISAEEATSSTEGVVLQTPTTHGNSFPVGQCTWGVKELAPWVNNWWGNAKDWAANAVAYNGYSIGDTPVVGSIAVWDGGSYGHVAYVTDVQSATSIQVLESNYLGQQQIGNYRGFFDPTTAQGKVTYIYPW